MGWMDWIDYSERRPTESGYYYINFSYSEHGKRKEEFILSKFRGSLEKFDLSVESFPEYQIQKWRKIY